MDFNTINYLNIKKIIKNYYKILQLIQQRKYNIQYFMIKLLIYFNILTYYQHNIVAIILIIRSRDKLINIIKKLLRNIG
jgi:hypothetical protein